MMFKSSKLNNKKLKKRHLIKQNKRYIESTTRQNKNVTEI